MAAFRPLPVTPPLTERSVRMPFALPIGVWIVIGAYGALLVWLTLRIPFPTRIDELQHYSVIRAQYEQATLFPDWSRYLLLRQDDLSRWSPYHNYINHPSLYYLLLAPLMGISGDPLLFRLANVLLSTLALLVTVIAVRRCMPADTVSPTLFALIAASFPKGAVVGGLINNDNLAALAAAVVFAGVVGMPAAGWWVMIGLAVAGWTKLTALLGLAATLFAWLGLRLIRRDIALTDPLFAFAGLGVAIGLIPYAVNLAETGQVLWVNKAVWWVPVAERAHYDMVQFASYFGRTLLWKWPADEGFYTLRVIAAGLLAMLGVAGFGLRRVAVRPIALAYMAGLIILMAIHFTFGWRSFQTMGDLTIAQTRYYNVLWPGIALAASTGIGVIARHWRPAPYALAMLFLAPTLVELIIHAMVVAM
ncbi:hypothetical protein U5A82_17635 [Sphingobium sp. CR2-8]|uniref:hypothetical protein n=1 Tax=Sphingobium sp. CR2-8 TaxID=1306534 RepID=UPI002DBF4A5D|nr:hypothetical protein [Sphingobium sp. CR2-8]MEC3912231.1 hypothetical protein [Sphingobium sp. CR2-8]